MSAADVDLDVWLPGLGAGDTTAFARWVAGAEPPLRRSLRAFAAAVDVEAVLQEALLRIWQVAPRFTPDGRPNALLRFAHRVARHLAISEARRLRAAPLDEATLADPASEGPGAAAGPVDPLLRRALVECRDKLPKKPAAALDARLAAAGGEADAALARGLGMTLNTFLQNFTRARKLLADCLERRGVELPS
jgi:RNA polymerase sigma-70 factor (ECF subfamily)